MPTLGCIQDPWRSCGTDACVAAHLEGWLSATDLKTLHVFIGGCNSNLGGEHEQIRWFSICFCPSRAVRQAQAGPELASTPTAELSSESSRPWMGGRRQCGFRGQAGRQTVLRCKADISDCPSRCEEADLEVPEGMRKAAGFLLAEDQLPPGLESHCLDALVAEVHQMCSQVSALTQQQALRLVLGMGYDRVAAVAKWREICAWRAANNMDEVRREQARKAASTEDIHFPGEDKVRKFIMVHPCALLAADGSPVSIWHGGTLASGMDLAPADITAWSHAVFEYKDLWVAQDSEATRTLKGYIQVYDLKDVSLRQLSRDTVEKLRCALQPGSYYMEAVSHMYVVNSSMVFSMAWKAGPLKRRSFVVSGKESHTSREDLSARSSAT